ncbi:MAG: ABC transporter substrate-binding protein [Actinomycetales bacterium]|nr:ABC transporter substrate-binding protein [Actinomycetales bacterium]
MKKSKTGFRLAAAACAGAMVLAACSSGSDDDKKEDIAKGDGEFIVGSLLPQTGSLAFLGPPEIAGVNLAVEEINEAGGVLGKPVRHVDADSGDTDSGIAPAETDKLLKAGVDVIVGAASSGVSLTVIDKILDSGTIMISPANTSTAFDEAPYDKPDLYFRTAPSDVLQGAVMANLLIEDGRKNVAIMARQDSYGQVLAEQVEKGLKDAGSKIAVTTFYGEKAKNFDTEIGKVAAAKPDALVLIAFDETTKIIPGLVAEGVGPKNLPTYFVDGNTANYGPDSSTPLPEGILEGVKGTVPGVEAPEGFRDRLLKIDPKLDNFTYAAEAYDATILTALAAVAAKNDSGEGVASEMVKISSDGTKCTGFKECADLLEDGEDLDYDGLSGPIAFSELGSPTEASIGIYLYGKDNNNTAVKFISGKI